MKGIGGTWGYQSGASGTCSVPKASYVMQIIVHATAAGSMTIFGGLSIPIPAGMAAAFRFSHDSLQSKDNGKTAGSQDIVFTGTDSFFVESFTDANVARAGGSP